jgi:Ion channel
MGQEQAGSFSEALDRTDSLYFTTTVFSTVGFGDITPKSEPARVLTMVQMLANLLIFGIAARLLVNAVAAGRRARGGPATAPAVTQPAVTQPTVTQPTVTQPTVTPPPPTPDGTIHTG